MAASFANATIDEGLYIYVYICLYSIYLHSGNLSQVMLRLSGWQMSANLADTMLGHVLGLEGILKQQKVHSLDLGFDHNEGVNLQSTTIVDT